MGRINQQLPISNYIDVLYDFHKMNVSNHVWVNHTQRIGIFCIDPVINHKITDFLVGWSCIFGCQTFDYPVLATHLFQFSYYISRLY